MKNIIIIILLSLLPLLWLSSCNDNSSEVDYNPNVLSSKDYIRAEDALFEIVNAFFKGIRDSLVVNYGYGYIDACDVSYHPEDNSMNFGYGNINRLCQDNKFRRGRFSATFSGQYLVEGVRANIITDSLFVDDYLIEANMEIQNLGINNNNLPEFSLKLISSLIMLPDTAKINGVNLTTDFLMVWAEGSLTPPIHEDDLYLISGTSSGVSSDGYEFSTEIQEPLSDYVDCFWISRGMNQITVPSAQFPTGDIDYIIEDGCYNQFYFYFNDNLFYDIIK
jgi:hypothetical protein